MRFISYAQNQEDVVLYRALKHVRHGCYIDVGACDPEEHSVTKAFYDMGWRGINIEPVAHWHERLMAARPEDVNLQVAAWSHADTIPFYEVLESGLSTACEQQALAYKHERGFAVIDSTRPAWPLRAILAEHRIDRAHFLKIDSEGSELQVLKGIDFSRFKPWIVVIESVEPFTEKPSWLEWNHILTDQGYEHCYFDGLNRFYVSAEHPELQEHLRTPPSSLDDFVLHREQRLLDSLSELRRKAFLLEMDKGCSRSSSPSQSKLPHCCEPTQVGAQSLAAIDGGGWYPKENHGLYTASWSGPENECWLDFPSPGKREAYLLFHVVGALTADQLLSLTASANGTDLQFARSQDELGFLHGAKLDNLHWTTEKIRVTFKINSTLRPCDVHPENPDRRLLGILVDRADIVCPGAHSL